MKIDLDKLSKEAEKRIAEEFPKATNQEKDKVSSRIIADEILKEAKQKKVKVPSRKELENAILEKLQGKIQPEEEPDDEKFADKNMKEYMESMDDELV